MRNHTTTKIDLIKYVAKQTGQTQAVVELVINALISQIAGSLASFQRVELRNFGVWEVYIGASRVGRNPALPEQGPIHIPPRPTVRFRSSQELKSTVQRSNKGKSKVLVAEPVAAPITRV
jgi:nucleoid DNA-binding protein